jgi:hypothetical protein
MARNNRITRKYKTINFDKLYGRDKGVELHRCTLSPDQLYRIDGAKIVKAD